MVEDIRRVMTRAQDLGMTGGDYAFIHYSAIVSQKLLQPWDDGSVQTSEQRAKMIDAFRPLKQVRFVSPHVVFAATTIRVLIVTVHYNYSRTSDERPPSPTTIPLIRPHFV